MCKGNPVQTLKFEYLSLKTTYCLPLVTNEGQVLELPLLSGMELIQ